MCARRRFECDHAAGRRRCPRRSRTVTKRDGENHPRLRLRIESSKRADPAFSGLVRNNKNPLYVIHYIPFGRQYRDDYYIIIYYCRLNVWSVHIIHILMTVHCAQYRGYYYFVINVLCIMLSVCTPETEVPHEIEIYDRSRIQVQYNLWWSNVWFFKWNFFFQIYKMFIVPVICYTCKTQSRIFDVQTSNTS